MPEQKTKGDSTPKFVGRTVHLVESDKVDTRKVIVVLEKANLQIALLKKKDTHVLLNGDDHADYITKKLHREPSDFRPDITHQCLLTLMDSPLNKAGKLEVYITTESNQVIKINPATRIPRTYKRFAALMAQLLKKLTIRAEESSETLLKIIQSPVTNHLPPESLKIALSTKGQLVDIFSFVKELDPEKPIVFLIGAVAKGNPTMEVDYYNEAYCISRYAMSASNCLARITTAFEEYWKIQ